MKYDSVNPKEATSKSDKSKRSYRSRHHLRVSYDNILDLGKKPNGIENIEGTSGAKKKHKKDKRKKSKSKKHSKEVDFLLANAEMLSEESDRGKNKEEVIMEIHQLEMKAKEIRAILKKEEFQETEPKSKKIKLSPAKRRDVSYLT